MKKATPSLNVRKKNGSAFLPVINNDSTLNYSVSLISESVSDFIMSQIYCGRRLLFPNLLTQSTPLPPIATLATSCKNRRTIECALNEGVTTILNEQPSNSANKNEANKSSCHRSSGNTSTAAELNNSGFPSLVGSSLTQSEAFQLRQLRYHQRHHQKPEILSASEAFLNHLRNKCRFSATGVDGNFVVVKDCEMTLSSHPTSLPSVQSNTDQVPQNQCFAPISSSQLVPLHYSGISLGSRYSPTIQIHSTPRNCAHDPEISSQISISSNKTLAETHGHPGSNNSASSINPPANCFVPSSTKPFCSKQKKSSDEDVIFVSMTPGPSSFVRLPPKKSYLRANKWKKITPEKPTSFKKRTALRPFATSKPYRGRPSLVSEIPLEPFVVFKNRKPSGKAGENKPIKYFLRSTRLSQVNVNISDKKSPPPKPKSFKEKLKRRFEDTLLTSPPPKRIKQSPPKEQPQSSNTPCLNSGPSPTLSSSSSLHSLENAAVHQLTKMSRRTASSSSFSKRYQIFGKLGEGGGGAVFKGARRSDNFPVAIKRVLKSKIRRWGSLFGKKVPIEFELLYKANETKNENIIKMIDWHERGSSFILVMERPEPAMDLFDYMHNREIPLKEDSAQKIFRKLVVAVMNCHQNGVVHRDVKDENVIVNIHTKEPMLIDFGCGTYVKAEPLTDFAGTHEFYPPEWFVDRCYEGWRVDCWSLAVLLYAMLEKELPFQNGNETVHRSVTFNHITNPVCRDLILWMLKKDPKQRPNLTEVLEHPWMTTSHAILNESTSSVTAAHLSSDRKSTVDYGSFDSSKSSFLLSSVTLSSSFKESAEKSDVGTTPNKKELQPSMIQKNFVSSCDSPTHSSFRISRPILPMPLLDQSEVDHSAISDATLPSVSHSTACSDDLSKSDIFASSSSNPSAKKYDSRMTTPQKRCQLSLIHNQLIASSPISPDCFVRPSAGLQSRTKLAFPAEKLVPLLPGSNIVDLSNISPVLKIPRSPCVVR